LKAYQDGIASGKVDVNDTAIFGISVDSPFANAKYRQELGISFQLLSDVPRKVTKDYGIWNDDRQFVSRTTFVVDKQGIIQHIEEGKSAVDTTGAITMCTTLKSKEKPN
jgi:peroxiredoxin